MHKPSLSSKRCCLALVPPGTTGLVQPLDVSVNAAFKTVIDRLQSQYMDENHSLYIEGKITASQCRVLISKLVGQPWSEVSLKTQMIYCAFEICGISAPMDGSKDDHINIRGLSDYQVDPVQQEEGLF